MIRLRPLATFLSFVIVVLVFGIPSRARASDADVVAVLDASHAAIASLDIGAIAAVWSHEADVTLINPRDTTVAVGWEAVKARWEQVFSKLSGQVITQTGGPYITTTGSVAWSVGIVHVVVHLKSNETRDVNFVETDILQRQDGHWRLVSHTAKPL